MTEQAVPTNLLQRFVERAGSLYSLPAVAVEVLELTGATARGHPGAEGLCRAGSGADREVAARREQFDVRAESRSLRLESGLVAAWGSSR